MRRRCPDAQEDQLEGSSRAELRAIDRIDALHILQSLDKLSATMTGDVKRLQNVDPPEFRLRMGDYRVRFYDHGDAMQILSVKHRREAYRTS